MAACLPPTPGLTCPCCTTDDDDERLPLLEKLGHHLVAVDVLAAQALGCDELQQDPLQLLLLRWQGRWRKAGRGCRQDDAAETGAQVTYG